MSTLCPRVHAVYAIWLNSNPRIAPVITPPPSPAALLDLSVQSPLLAEVPHWRTPAGFDALIARGLAAQSATVGIGGYAERRPFYTTPAYALAGAPAAPRRDIHLGVDFWTTAGTPVYAPLAGTVHAVHDNASSGDYGPTLILRHHPSQTALTFYTLYGHLGNEVLANLSVGQPVTAGQQIATIGARPHNGDWPPHLHFQIVMDLLDHTTNFPGVASSQNILRMLSICPDPAPWFPQFFTTSWQ